MITDDKKELIVRNLKVLLRDRVAKNEKWKVKAYTEAIKAIEGYPHPIYALEDVSRIQKVGKSMLDKLRELFDKGYIQEVRDIEEQERVHGHTSATIEELMKVSGIGPVKAKDLVEKHQITSIAVLKTKPELLNDKQKIGLKYVDDFQKRIPRKEIDVHLEFVRKFINVLHPSIRFEITGSYRRGAASSGDIDILLTCDDESVVLSSLLHTLVDNLNKTKYLRETIALGDKKYMGVCRLPKYKTHRRIDIMFTPKHEYPFALLYFTGSAEFNVAMRSWALAHQPSYTMNEHGLKLVGTHACVEHVFLQEKDIFEFLGLRYVEPINRVGQDALVSTQPTSDN
jgi:DNA polymerase beta